jgi:3-oxoacyl-[acyl-carrier-protein] synthase-3
MFGEITNVAIAGMSAVAPKNKINNMQTLSSEFSEKKIKRQIKMTGIKERHVDTSGIGSETLCIKAAKSLLEHLDWAPDSIRVLVYVTETPKIVLPSTAFFIQKEIGLGTDCIVFDVNLGCSGWVAGVQIASQLLKGIEREKNGKPPRALLLTGSISTSHIKPEDISTAMLFGDGGAATALELREESIPIPFMQMSDGRGYQHIWMENLSSNVFMDGGAVFEFTINQVLESIREFIGHFAIKDNEVDYYVFHQAQKFIVDNLIDFLEIDTGKTLHSYDCYGNTAAAAIPITICHEKDKLLEKTRLLTAVFGTGLSWGALLIELEACHVLDVQFIE